MTNNRDNQIASPIISFRSIHVHDHSLSVCCANDVLMLGTLSMLTA